MGLLTGARAVKLIGMNLKERNPSARDRQTPSEEAVYPAEFHFRIIVDAQMEGECLLGPAVAGFKVTAPLTTSRQSATGRYLAYSLSVRIESREELNTFEAAIKRVPGVRMLL